MVRVGKKKERSLARNNTGVGVVVVVVVVVVGGGGNEEIRGFVVILL